MQHIVFIMHLDASFLVFIIKYITMHCPEIEKFVS